MMDQKKRKRMISNRESARRSRMRKQKRLDDLRALVSQLRKENGYILTQLSLSNRMCLNVEEQNSVLRAQAAELTQRLNSLNEIVNCTHSACSPEVMGMGCEAFMNPSWNMLCPNQPTMVSSSDFFLY